MALSPGESITLPEPRDAGALSVEESLAQRRSVRAFSQVALSVPEIAQILWAAQGLSHGGARRTVPSAGALYPLEIYLAGGAIEGLDAGVYRYRPRHHELELKERGDRRSELAEAALGQDWVADAPAILVIAAELERTTGKYGGRGERYVHIEVGHAAQNVYLQAQALGLGTTAVGAFRDAEIARLTGLAPEQRPFLLLPIGRPR